MSAWVPSSFTLPSYLMQWRISSGSTGLLPRRVPERLARVATAIHASAPLEHPLLLVQEFDGAFDRLTDGEAGLPAQSPELRAVEKNEGTVADPAALSASINELGRHFHVRANPSDGIVHRAVLVGAEVVHDAFFRGRPDDREHGVHAVLHVEVRFSLLAIAEHVEPIGMSPKLSIEIEDVSVRIPLAENGN